MTSSNWCPSFVVAELIAHPMVTVATLLGNENTHPAIFNTHQIQAAGDATAVERVERPPKAR